jgi:ParB/RepB/Spo0J family partition protein
MNPRRRPTSPVLTRQVAGGTLGQIMTEAGARALPQARPSLRQVPVDRIVCESDLQTRALFDPQSDPEDAELVDSVREVGVRVPVHLQDQGDNTYRVRSGHRRVCAARAAGQDFVPAIVWPPGADAFDSALDTWLENLHRKDLAPLERAETLSRLMDRFDLPSCPETAARLGLSKTSFYRYLSLTRAPEDVKQAIADGTLGVAHGERIAAIEAPEVRARLIGAAKEGIPATQMDDALRRYRAGEGIPDHTLGPGRRTGGDGKRSGRQDGVETWTRGKIRELGDALGLSTTALEPIAKGLKARRASSAQATAAAVLVAVGRSPIDALSDVDSIERPALRAVETLFKTAYMGHPGSTIASGQIALGQILGVLQRKLESGSSNGVSD